MPVLTDEEADALDELLTKTTPKTNPDVQGPFIKDRKTMVILAIILSPMWRGLATPCSGASHEIRSRYIRQFYYTIFRGG
jgi:hypothetical protein